MATQIFFETTQAFQHKTAARICGGGTVYLTNTNYKQVTISGSRGKLASSWKTCNKQVYYYYYKKKHIIYLLPVVE